MNQRERERERHENTTYVLYTEYILRYLIKSILNKVLSDTVRYFGMEFCNIGLKSPLINFILYINLNHSTTHVSPDSV